MPHGNRKRSTISFENIESESISLFITNSMDYVNEDIVKDHILGCYIHKNIPFYFIGKFDSDNRLQNKIFKIEEEVDTTYILSLRKNGSLYIKNDYY